MEENDATKVNGHGLEKVDGGGDSTCRATFLEKGWDEIIPNEDASIYVFYMGQSLSIWRGNRDNNSVQEDVIGLVIDINESRENDKEVQDVVYEIFWDGNLQSRYFVNEDMNIEGNVNENVEGLSSLGLKDGEVQNVDDASSDDVRIVGRENSRTAVSKGIAVTAYDRIWARCLKDALAEISLAT